MLMWTILWTVYRDDLILQIGRVGLPYINAFWQFPVFISTTICRPCDAIMWIWAWYKFCQCILHLLITDLDIWIPVNILCGLSSLFVRWGGQNSLLALMQSVKTKYVYVGYIFSMKIVVLVYSETQEFWSCDLVFQGNSLEKFAKFWTGMESF